MSSRDNLARANSVSERPRKQQVNAPLGLAGLLSPVLPVHDQTQPLLAFQFDPFKIRLLVFGEINVEEQLGGLVDTLQ